MKKRFQKTSRNYRPKLEYASPMPHKRPTVLIVGCGDVGLKLVAWLRAKHPASRLRIVATHRTAAKAATIRRAGAIPLHLDLDSPNPALALSGIAHWTINLSPPPSDPTQKSSLAADPRSIGLAKLLCANAGTTVRNNLRRQRLTYISTSGVYGDCQGQWVSEERPLRPKNARAHRRVAAEAIHRALGASVLRAPGIYGHDRLPLDRLKAGTPALVESEDTYTNHIHATDLARLSWLALFRAKPKRVYNASDDSVFKMGEYFDAVASAFGLPYPPRKTRAEIAREVSPMMLSFMSESRRLSNTRLKREICSTLLYPTVADTLNSAL